MCGSCALAARGTRRRAHITFVEGFGDSKAGRGLANFVAMLWFFERDDKAAVVEVRRREALFEIVVRQNETESVQVAAAASELFAHLEAVPRRLMAEGWRPRPSNPLLAIPGPRQ